MDPVVPLNASLSLAEAKEKAPSWSHYFELSKKFDCETIYNKTR